MNENGRRPVVKEPVKVFTQATISQIALTKSNKLFFFGTKEKDLPGSLRVTRYPFSEEGALEIQSHAKAISKVKVSFDDNFVFTTGEDGALIIYEIKDNACMQTVFYFGHLCFRAHFLTASNLFSQAY